MKLLGLFIVGSFGVKLDKNTANQFLARNRRANSWGEELRKRGDLERECVEESCDFNEFNEVYDDMKVSQPLWYKFADCKNYVSKRLTPEKQKEQLRTCFKGAQDRPVPNVPKPIPNEQEIKPTPRPVAPNTEKILPSGPYSSGSEPLPDRGFADKSDTLWVQLIKDANAKSRAPIPHNEALISRVHCKMTKAHDRMIGGSKEHICKVTYEHNQHHCVAQANSRTCIGCYKPVPKFSSHENSCN